MIKRLTDLFHKYREGILYLFFGGLTTLVNYIIYIAYFWVIDPKSTTVIPNVLAWIGAVLFAYVTNRTWVFRSEATGASAISREILAFAGARVFTLVLETAILWVTVDYLALPNLLMKLLCSVIVVVLNYVFSKLWVFKS
jgi:putative flippase GtrA